MSLSKSIAIEIANLSVALIYLATTPFSLLHKLKILFQYVRLLLPLDEKQYRCLWFNVKHPDRRSLRYLFLEIFIGNEYYFKSEVAHPKIIDCGANIGLTVMYLKSLNPNCAIIAFEPDPTAFDFLEKNIKINTLDGVEMINKGVSNRDGTAQFFYNNNIPASMTNSIHRPIEGNSVTIDVLRLSTYINNVVKGNVDLLKIDIEGEEINLLPDLIDTKAINKISELYIEYHHNIKGQQSTLGIFIGSLEEVGFKVNVRSSPYPVGTKDRFQDIMIHAYKGMH